jgi:hypothetical protein
MGLCPYYFRTLACALSSLNLTIQQDSISKIEPKTYHTMLQGRSVTFQPRSDADPDAPDWARVQLEDDVHITSMREVRPPFHRPFLSLIWMSIGFKRRLICYGWDHFG